MEYHIIKRFKYTSGDSMYSHIRTEKTPEGKKVKELELYKQSAINSVFECGVPEQLNIVLEKVLNGVGIIWNKTKALQLENKSHN